MAPESGGAERNRSALWAIIGNRESTRKAAVNKREQDGWRTRGGKEGRLRRGRDTHTHTHTHARAHGDGGTSPTPSTYTLERVA